MRQLKALNHQESGRPRACLALNFTFKDPADVPEWIELLPAGPTVQGRDGRAWRLIPDDVVQAFNADNADLPVDIEHATELRGPEGKPAPAVGWITGLEARNGAVWGRVEWNNSGGVAISERQYRYISPVFLYDKEGRIVKLTSAALTNQPNLRLTALNREGITQPMEARKMKKIYDKLGLAATATEDEAVAAIAALQADLDTARNRAENPNLEKFVPRADYDAACNRAATAEDELAALAKSRLEEEIEMEITAALTAGKITPATVDYHKANCREDGGLERFRAFVAAAPVMGGPSGLDGKEAPDSGGKALNAQEKEICATLGIDEEDFLKTK